jgi:hypothetical protein
MYFFFQPNQQQVPRCAVPFTNLSILWKMLGQNHFGNPTKPSCFDFSSSNFPFQSWWSCSDLIPISQKDDTLWLLLPYFYLRKGLVWPVPLAQVLPHPQLIFPSKT